MRRRKLIASLIMVVALAAYALVVAELVLYIDSRHWALQAVIYAIAGMAWIYPAALLLRWAHRDPG